PHPLQAKGKIFTPTHTSGVTPSPHPAKIRPAFEWAGRLATTVRSARTAGHFPLVLSGNCNTAVGTLSGLTPARRATFWFDAHGDCNTPETTNVGLPGWHGPRHDDGSVLASPGSHCARISACRGRGHFSTGRSGPRSAGGGAFTGVGHYCHPSRSDPGRALGPPCEGGVGGYPRLSPLGRRCAGSGRRPRELPAGPQRPLPSPPDRRDCRSPRSGSARRRRAHLLFARRRPRSRCL